MRKQKKNKLKSSIIKEEWNKGFNEALKIVYQTNLPKEELERKISIIENKIIKENKKIIEKNYYVHIIELSQLERPLLHYFLSAGKKVIATKANILRKNDDIQKIKKLYYEVTYDKKSEQGLLKFFQSEFDLSHSQDYQILKKGIISYLKSLEEKNPIRTMGAEAINYWFKLPFDKKNKNNISYKVYDRLQIKYRPHINQDPFYLLEQINETGLKVLDDKIKNNKIPKETATQVALRIDMTIRDKEKSYKNHKEIEAREHKVYESVNIFEKIYGNEHSIVGLEAFLEYLRTTIFTKKNRQQKMLDIWIKIAPKREVDWKIFEDDCLSEWKKIDASINRGYFLKIMGEVFKTISKYPILNQVASESLKLIRAQPFEKEIKLIKKYVRNNSSANLTTYRFNSMELEKMLELKSIFTNKGLGENKFEINRFPNVYYDTSEKFEQLYGPYKTVTEEEKDQDAENNDIIKEDDWGEGRISPDTLGCYFDFNIPGEDFITQEGKIILFKDKIEAFCAKHKDVKEEQVRLIILLHELGHWVTHWPKANDDNWILGYSGKDIKTHESLAQLICYWLVEGDSDLKECFERQLTPTNPNNPYALYKKLTNINRMQIIMRIIALRTGFFLPDHILYEYLCLDNFISAVEVHGIIDLFDNTRKDLFVDYAQELAYFIVNSTCHNDVKNIFNSDNWKNRENEIFSKKHKLKELKDEIICFGSNGKAILNYKNYISMKIDKVKKAELENWLVSHNDCPSWLSVTEEPVIYILYCINNTNNDAFANDTKSLLISAKGYSIKVGHSINGIIDALKRESDQGPTIGKRKVLLDTLQYIRIIYPIHILNEKKKLRDDISSWIDKHFKKVETSAQYWMPFETEDEEPLDIIAFLDSL